MALFWTDDEADVWLIDDSVEVACDPECFYDMSYLELSEDNENFINDWAANGINDYDSLDFSENLFSTTSDYSCELVLYNYDVDNYILDGVRRLLSKPVVDKYRIVWDIGSAFCLTFNDDTKCCQKVRCPELLLVEFSIWSEIVLLCEKPHILWQLLIVNIP